MSLFTRTCVSGLCLAASGAHAFDIPSHSVTVSEISHRALELSASARPILEACFQLFGVVLFLNVVLLCIDFAKEDLHGSRRVDGYIVESELGDIIRRSLACVICFSAPTIIESIALQAQRHRLIPMAFEFLHYFGSRAAH